MDKQKIYRRVIAEDLNEYICPLEITLNKGLMGIDDLEECVEADVVGRYIGSLNIIDGG